MVQFTGMENGNRGTHHTQSIVILLPNYKELENTRTLSQLVSSLHIQGISTKLVPFANIVAAMLRS
jgi:hypothetical protein